jgi:transcription-repair coupling factor
MLVKDYGVHKLDASDAQISVQFAKDAPIDPVKVIFLIQKDRSTKMAGPEKLVRRASLPNLKERVKAVKDLLDAVKADTPNADGVKADSAKAKALKT